MGHIHPTQDNGQSRAHTYIHRTKGACLLTVPSLASLGGADGFASPSLSSLTSCSGFLRRWKIDISGGEIELRTWTVTQSQHTYTPVHTGARAHPSFIERKRERVAPPAWAACGMAPLSDCVARMGNVLPLKCEGELFLFVAELGRFCYLLSHFLLHWILLKYMVNLCI